MNRALLWRTVLLRVKRYRLRSAVIAAGICISVLAAVLLQSVAVSVRQAFDVFIDRMYPADGVVLMAGGGFMGGRAGRTNLKLTDVETVAAETGIAEWDPLVMVGGREVRRGGNSVRVAITGFSEKAESVRRRSVQEGEFFTADDVTTRANVALIGSTTAAELFPGESPIGAQLFIDNVPFEIRGVLESVGVDPHGGNMDQAIVIPYTTLMDEIARIDFVSGTTFIIDDPERADAVREEILRTMRERHAIGPGQEDDFVVITPVMVKAMANKSFRIFDLFVPAIAAAAFLISAGVIFSVMQLNIRARTAELGLRKAVGARSRDLEVQIVLEVLILAAGASLLGLLLASLGSTLVTPLLAAKFGVKQVTPSLTASILAALAALATGVAGGLVPARRAAKLDAVQSLR
ncbi:MAG TPA: ABC transporter permease [Thermoanaerobaculia bacterium]|nr:ABC transporter permease [Thermoanaerobaculia bacterium]